MTLHRVTRLLTTRSTLRPSLPIRFSHSSHTTVRTLTTTRPLLSELQPPDYLNPAEHSIFQKLQTALQPSKLDVQDISGGCGSMYGLEIESERFRGLPVVRQHKIVNEVLKEEISGWHGVQLKTRAPA